MINFFTALKAAALALFTDASFFADVVFHFPTPPEFPALSSCSVIAEFRAPLKLFERKTLATSRLSSGGHGDGPVPLSAASGWRRPAKIAMTDKASWCEARGATAPLHPLSDDPSPPATRHDFKAQSSLLGRSDLHSRTKKRR